MEAAVHGRNGVPILERTIDLLAALERSEAGVTIRVLTQQLGLPRSTIYRILNTLQAYDFVRRDGNGAYQLGARLLALASRVHDAERHYDLTALATPFMQRLSEETGEPSKLSVIEGDEALVVAAVQGTHEYSPTPVVGLRYPLHAGAASKMILAHLPEAERNRLLDGPLASYSPNTVTDAAALRIELRQIRRQGFARDSGEHRASVHAIAAPIIGPGGSLAGALSIPFLADRDAAVRRRLKDAIIRTAAAISAAIPKVS